MQFCKNNNIYHYCCYDCFQTIIKTENPMCPICRNCKIMILPFVIYYSNAFTKEEILSDSKIDCFIGKFFYCRQDGSDGNDSNGENNKNNIFAYKKYFDNHQLQLLSSAKRNIKYKLYKEVCNSKIQNNQYTCNTISIWSLDRENIKNEQIMQCEMNPENILMDLDYLCNDVKRSVLVLNGTYDISIVDTALVRQNHYISNLCITDFTEDHKKELMCLKTSKFKVTKQHLFSLCKQYNIPAKSNSLKIELVERLILKNISGY